MTYSHNLLNAKVHSFEHKLARIAVMFSSKCPFFVKLIQCNINIPIKIKMFKLAVYLRSDGVSLNPFACNLLHVYMCDHVIIMDKEIFDQAYMSMSKIRVAATIVIGEGSFVNVTFVKDFKECMQLVASEYKERTWWVVGNNLLMNELIWNGLVMDIHLSKCYAKKGTREWDIRTEQIIYQTTLFDKSLLGNPEMEFTLLSSVKTPRTKQTKHYLRRNHEEQSLLATMKSILLYGHIRPNRTGINTRCMFAQQFEYHMIERVDPETGLSSFRLPLLTTKKMFLRGVFEELKWFLGGCTNSKILEEKGINIWKGNSSRAFLDSVGLSDYEEGECGPIYGFQWRHFGATYVPNKTDYTGEGIDQVAQVIESLQKDPFSRRHIINAWNVADIDKMALPPCHHTYQFMCHEENGKIYLSVFLYQRSCDAFHGLGFNICSLGIFLMLMCHQTGYFPYALYHSISDMHIYETHFDAASKQIEREPYMFPYIRVGCEPKMNIEDYEFSDIIVENYNHYPSIKADMVV